MSTDAGFLPLLKWFPTLISILCKSFPSPQTESNKPNNDFHAGVPGHKNVVQSANVRFVILVKLKVIFQDHGVCECGYFTNEPRKKPLYTPFHYPGCFLGILIMVYYNAYITGEYNALYTPTNHGFLHCSNKIWSWSWLSMWQDDYLEIREKKAMAEVCHIVIFVENPASFNSLVLDKKHNN